MPAVPDSTIARSWLHGFPRPPTPSQRETTMDALQDLPVPGPSRARRRGHAKVRAIVTAGVLLATAGPGGAQNGNGGFPFRADESLSYRAVSSRFGTIGTGTLAVSRAGAIRGEAVYRLGFEFRGRVGPFRVSDATFSWVSTDRLRSIRYHKRERSPLGSRDERVEIYPAERWWQAVGGASGDTPTSDPLDELSFLYFIRTLPLADGESHTLARHFDRERNPVRVRVLRRERTTVPAGEFATIVVEMRVRDSRVFGGDGTLRLFLTDDERRIPVRIESSAPWVGATSMLLLRTP